MTWTKIPRRRLNVRAVTNKRWWLWAKQNLSQRPSKPPLIWWGWVHVSLNICSLITYQCNSHFISIVVLICLSHLFLSSCLVSSLHLLLSQAQENSSTSSTKKKNKFVNLYNKEGQDRLAVLLPGRCACDCLAQKHKLINNCISCGRIACEQEGSGPCLFCGSLVWKSFWVLRFHFFNCNLLVVLTILIL